MMNYMKMKFGVSHGPETSDSSATLTNLINREHIIAYCHREIFKLCVRKVKKR
jgi:hypothetical protein